MRLVALLLACLTACPTPARAADPVLVDPVTYMGRHLLVRSHAVIEGEFVSTSRIATGAEAVSLRVAEVLYGEESRRRVLLLGSDKNLLPEPGIPAIFFLRRLGEGRYEPLGRIDLVGADARFKRQVLKAYLGVEILTDGAAKRKALRDLLVENLESNEPFLLWSAARELAHFSEKNARWFSEEDTARLRRRASGVSDPTLKDLLGAALKNLGRDLDGEEGTASGPVEGPAVGLPAPREFRKLAKTWESRPRDPDERLAIVLTLSARYLRYAGPILLSALADEDADVRRVAAVNLGEAEVTAAGKPLLEMLAGEKVKAVQAAAIQSLGILRYEEARPAIIRLGRDPELTSAAAFAVARIGGDEALDWLRALKALRTGDGEPERKLRRLVDFLLSDDFRKQEEAMKKIRAKRLGRTSK